MKRDENFEPKIDLQHHDWRLSIEYELLWS
jgi:hypothetical protein